MLRVEHGRAVTTSACWSLVEDIAAGASESGSYVMVSMNCD